MELLRVHKDGEVFIKPKYDKDTFLFYHCVDKETVGPPREHQFKSYLPVLENHCGSCTFEEVYE